VRPAYELTHVERATVFKGGVPAARLVRHRVGVELTYLEDYLEAGLPPLATTLPVSSEPVMTHSPGALPPFFSGMLPEGRRLTALRLAAKTSADDEFTLLLVVGNDAVGDVQVVPEGYEPSETEPRVSVGQWSQIRFADVFGASIGDQGAVDRVAIAGVQDKISARMINVPVAVEQALATTAIGLRPCRSASRWTCSRAGTCIRNSASVGTGRTLRSPRPMTPAARVML